MRDKETCRLYLCDDLEIHFSHFIISVCVASSVALYSYFLCLEVGIVNSWRDVIPSLITIANTLWFFQTFRIRLIMPAPRTGDVFLKKKAKDIFNKFLTATRVRYLGMCDDVHHNVSGTAYPIDFFVQRMYDRYYPKYSRIAHETYRRVNPTLDLKLGHLEKFAAFNKFDADETEIAYAIDAVYQDFKRAKGYDDMLFLMRNNIHGKCFRDLVIDGTSAAGHPYGQGVKRRDCMEDAVHKAGLMMDNERLFDEYMEDHKWYSTGRARMISQQKEDKGRLILYAGFAPMMIAMLFLQPLAGLMNSSIGWCSVGMSWMNGGARKFAERFKAESGYAPKGFRFVSVDIKEWDTKLHPKLMQALYTVHKKILNDVGSCSYTSRYLKILNDMINCVVLFPMGYVFQIFQGMKSGWASTANDNTLIHEIVFKIVMKRLGYIFHTLYGDDNFMLVPDSVSDEDIISEYARLGCIVGTIHSSTYIGDVDFLSKYIMFRDGQYVIYRPAVETHARLLMPEELNPAKRDRPDPIVSAEKIYGHLLDNPFCGEVREVCMNLLGRLNKHYGVGHIVVTPEMSRKYPWKGFEGMPTYLPIKPDIKMIEDLYGVCNVPLMIEWPSMVEARKCDWLKRDFDCEQFYDAMLLSTTASIRIGRIGSKRIRTFIKLMSPFVVPQGVYGTHAGRLECVMKMFGLSGGKNALDLGSHPGACTVSMLKAYDFVKSVSLQSEHDDERTFCPYIIRDERVNVVNADVDGYENDDDVIYDLVHDDTDKFGARTRTEDHQLVLNAINRAERYYKNARNYIFTIRAIDPQIMMRLYDVYKKYGSFDIVKPHFSNPWRVEFVVVLRRASGHAIRRRDFIGSLNHFLNRESEALMAWATVVTKKTSEMIEHRQIECCPYRNDDDAQRSITDNYIL